MLEKIKLELLAPAKDKEVAIAAILAGADAIFIGGASLGARVEASNSFESLKEITDFAHLFNVRVHLTLNTLVKDEEIATLQEYLYKAKDCGIDAIIFQDLTLLSLDIPNNIELHASTQCDISSLEKVGFFASLGVKQVVLARETTIEELKSYKEHYPNLKFEVFVAGAMCVGQSGICHISDYMLKRSANRGSCAQICRLNMELLDSDKKVLKKGYLLSMKDNFALNDLENLVLNGASSFKIEGRLKDKYFVANQVALFSDKLNEIIKRYSDKYERSSCGIVERNFLPNPYKTFNRGFSSNLLHNDNSFLVNDKSPKSMGQLIGKVINVNKNVITVSLKNDLISDTFVNGDSFVYLDNDELVGFRANRVEREGKVIYLYPQKTIKIQKGVDLYRNKDVFFIKSLDAKHALRRYFKVNIILTKEYDLIKLNLDDNDYAFYNLEDNSLDNSFNFRKITDETSFLKDPDFKNLKVLLKLSYAITDSKKLFKKDYYLKVKKNDLLELNKEKIYDTLKKTNNEAFIVNEISYDDTLILRLNKLNAWRKVIILDFIESFAVLYDTKKALENTEKINYKDKLLSSHYPYKTIDKRLILNKRLYSIYQNLGVNLLGSDKKIVENSLMTTRHCLLKSYVKCKKEGGSTLGFSLRIGNRIFPLSFDCKACKMHVLKDK